MRTIDAAPGEALASTRSTAPRPRSKHRPPADSTDLEPRTAIALLLLAVGVATALRLFGANDQLWFDEIATLLDSVRKPLGVIVTHFPSDNDHVFYSVLAHISIALGGQTPFMLRLPAILCGIASIPLIYTVGIRVTTRFEALAAAMLATVAAQYVWFSQNARGYTLLLLLTLLGTQLILDGLKTRSIKPWLGFAVASSLGAYTHLSMVLAVLGQAVGVALYLLTSRRLTIADTKGPAIGFIGAAALTIILYLPMLGHVAGFFHGQAATSKPMATNSGILHMLANEQLGFIRGSVLVIGGAVFLVGLVSYCRESSLIPTLFFIPPVLVYVATVLLERPTRPRFFFFIAGFLVLVGIRGVFVIIHFVLERAGPSWLSYEKSVRWVAVAALTGLLLIDLSGTYAKPKMDYEGALAYVDHSRRPDDVVALAGIGADFVYTNFYDRNWLRLTSANDLAALRRGHDVLVLHTFERPLSAANPVLLEALKTRCTEERSFPGTLQDGDIHISRCTRGP